MANYQQAPILKHNGTKRKDVITYQIPQDLFAFFSKLPKYQMSLMCYLVGNLDGFRPSTQHILDNTNICDKTALRKTKQALEARGWISYTAGNDITAEYDNIYRDMDKEESGSENDDGD